MLTEIMTPGLNRKKASGFPVSDAGFFQEMDGPPLLLFLDQ
jgi:hypothetical protein